MHQKLESNLDINIVSGMWELSPDYGGNSTNLF